MTREIKTSISLEKKEFETLKKIAEQEKRSISKQLMYMMEFYIKNKKD